MDDKPNDFDDFTIHWVVVLILLQTILMCSLDLALSLLFALYQVSTCSQG